LTKFDPVCYRRYGSIDVYQCKERAMQAESLDAQTLPVLVIGAGPVGLSAAARLVEAGETPLVVEAGERVAASVREWGHVRLFSSWRHNLDDVATDLLAQVGWQRPVEDEYPTAAELVEDFLEPLAAHPRIAPHLRLATRVVAVSRRGFDVMKSDDRAESSFVALLRRADGVEGMVEAKAVIDASGTWATPNPLGASGLPAVGETALRDRIRYGIPDVLGAERDRYADQRTLVVGSGDSAFNAILALTELARAAPRTRAVWAIRRASVGLLFGGGENDGLVERGRLGGRVRSLVEEGLLELVLGFQVEELDATRRGALVRGGGRELGPFDQIIASTGARPDPSLLRELRLDLDQAVEAPRALAPMIDPNVHSCGTVRPHGAVELGHPDPNAFIVGVKSYGRAPTFLLLTGYEQVRSVIAAIQGDWNAACDVHLELPDTGVCQGDVLDSFPGEAATPRAPGAEPVREMPAAVGVAAVGASGRASQCCR
jgi:thioredoxin reductase